MPMNERIYATCWQAGIPFVVPRESRVACRTVPVIVGWPRLSVLLHRCKLSIVGNVSKSNPMPECMCVTHDIIRFVCLGRCSSENGRVYAIATTTSMGAPLYRARTATGRHSLHHNHLHWIQRKIQLERSSINDSRFH